MLTDVIAQRALGFALCRSRLIEKYGQARILWRFAKFVLQRVDGAYRLGDFSAQPHSFRAIGGGHRGIVPDEFSYCSQVLLALQYRSVGSG